MSFKLENFGADASNIKSILGGANYYRYFNKDNNTLTTPGYFPADLGLAVGDRIKVIPSVKTNPDELYVVTSTANRTVTVTQIDTDGAVDSVNGKTGNVVLDASDVGAVPQYETMPTASADNEGQIVQFTGTTDANYTNGYFYKCTGAGEPVVYSWSQVDVQPAPDPLPSQTGNNGKFLSTNGTTASWETVGGLPDQTGNAGKFLTTDGTDASWGSISALQNTATGGNALTVIGTPTTKNKSVNIGSGSQATQPDCVVIGTNASSNSSDGVAIGGSASATTTGSGATAIGNSTQANSNYATAIGYLAKALARASIQLGRGSNNTSNTFCVGNDNGNFEMMDANGKIPADRIADTTGLTAGNYLPRLTIDAQGNKTITWVAE